MPVIQKQAIMPYSAQQMYALVDDIPSYPDFLPWCKQAIELERNADEVRATLTLASNGLEKSFTTHNHLRPGHMIELRLVDGPFKQLEGFWRFSDQADQPGMSMVRLDLDYEFNSKVLQWTMGPLFKQIASQLVTRFCDRAHVVYGDQSDSTDQP